MGQPTCFIETTIAEAALAVELALAGYLVPALLIGRPAVALHKEFSACGLLLL